MWASQAKVQSASLIKSEGGEEGPLNRGGCLAPTRSVRRSCHKPRLPSDAEPVSTMSWDNFKTFNNKLKGQDVSRSLA